MGRSIGGAVAIYAASQAKNHISQKIQGVILENTFTSIIDVVCSFAKFLEYLRLPLYLLVSQKWNSLKAIKNVQAPTLFMMADRDELIPIRQMEKLFA